MSPIRKTIIELRKDRLLDAKASLAVTAMLLENDDRTVAVSEDVNRALEALAEAERKMEEVLK